MYQTPVFTTESQPSTERPASVATTDTNTQIVGAEAKKEVTNKSVFKNMGDFKKAVGPEMYKQMMLGMATMVCNDMQHHSDHLVEIIREGERAAQGA